MKRIYNEGFYKTRHEDTLYSAETILQLVQNTVPKINSAIEFGCGVGTWLYVLKERGVEEILGLDGPWVPPEFRVIPHENFIPGDFEKPICPKKRYDLAISLEVAEHISQKHAVQFIESITNASDYVLFSAAIPGQGGSDHINEQYPSYWNKLFYSFGFCAIDYIRPKIWDNEKIRFWYRQNTIIYVKEEKLNEYSELYFSSNKKNHRLHSHIDLNNDNTN